MCTGSTLLRPFLSASFHNFIKLGSQHKSFPENDPKLSEQLFLCNTSGQPLLKIQTILIVPTHTTPFLYGNMGEAGGGTAKAEICFFIAECGDHLVRYGWWGR